MRKIIRIRSKTSRALEDKFFSIRWEILSGWEAREYREEIEYISSDIEKGFRRIWGRIGYGEDNGLTSASEEMWQGVTLEQNESNQLSLLGRKEGITNF